MDTTFFIVILSLLTLLAVCIFALFNKAKVERLRRDPHSSDSALSKNSPGPSAVEKLDR